MKTRQAKGGGADLCYKRGRQEDGKGSASADYMCLAGGEIEASMNEASAKAEVVSRTGNRDNSG